MIDFAEATFGSAFAVGLTGGIGAGKSVVAQVWAEHGAGVVEGDEMGRLALEQDADLRKRLAERFGSKILASEDKIDRRKLATVAFADHSGQRDLTRLTFPTLYSLARKGLMDLTRNHQVVVFDAALIFEWGVEQDFDLIVAVDTPRERMAKNAVERLGITELTALARLAMQISPQMKCRLAHEVIHNDDDLDELRESARLMWDRITTLAEEKRTQEAKK
jgi:dephospho-CoA kinase